MMNGSIPGRGRVLATLAVGAALLAAGCGGGSGGGSSSASGSSDQKEVAFAHCMRSHGVPGFPDPLPQGGFARNGVQKSPQFGPAFKGCQHLLPPRQAASASQEHQVMAQALQDAKCMRSHGVPGFPDPTALPGGGVVTPSSAGFDQNSPQAQAAGKACKILAPAGAPQGG
jgi:hypothetical protein